jgi:hypothetical protein
MDGNNRGRNAPRAESDEIPTAMSKDALTMVQAGAILRTTLADSVYFASPSQAAPGLRAAAARVARFAAARSATRTSLPQSNHEQSTHPRPMEA